MAWACRVPVPHPKRNRMTKKLVAQRKNTRLIAGERGERGDSTFPAQNFLTINGTDFLTINGTDKLRLGGTTTLTTIELKTLKKNTRLIAGE